MAYPKGKPNPNGGRPKGVPNKTTIAAKEAHLKLVQDVIYKISKSRKLKMPLEFLVDSMNSVNTPFDLRIQCANICMPYLHQKMPMPIEHTGKDGGPIEYAETRSLLAGLLGLDGDIEEQAHTVH